MRYFRLGGILHLVSLQGRRTVLLLSQFPERAPRPYHSPYMVFAYYHRLSTAQKRVYRKSDAVAVIRLPQPTPLKPLVMRLSRALQAENKSLTQCISQELADGITTRLHVPAVRIELLAVRPTDDWGELHGLYTPSSTRKHAVIQLWMRTAHYKRVVAFKSFLRTLLHELCHHIDYELLDLADSLHTEGFYKRTASLFHQIVESE